MMKVNPVGEIKNLVEETEGFDWQRYKQKAKESPNSGKLMIAVAVLQTLVLVGINSAMLGIGSSTLCEKKDGGVLEDCSTPSMVAYAISFIVGTFFMLIYVLNGVVTLNMWEVAGFMGTSFCITAYSIYKYVTMKELKNYLYDVVVLVVCCFCSVVSCVALVFFYREFRWRFWMKVGGDVEFRALYRYYQIYKTFLKFDLMIGIIVGVMAGFNSDSSLEKALSISSLVVNIVVVLLGWLSIRNEDYRLYVLFLIFCVAGSFLYLPYKLYLFHKDENHTFVKSYQFGSFAAGFWFVRLLMLLLSVLCAVNFGKGVKHKDYLTTTNLGEGNVPFIAPDDDDEGLGSRASRRMSEPIIN